MWLARVVNSHPLEIGKMGNAVGKIVSWVEQHAHLTILILTMLTAVAGIYSFLYASIDSDLSKLIKPSAETLWYQDNENYKRTFPDSQQTAVVVVSGNEYGDVEMATHVLAEALRESDEFQFVRTPGLDPFFEQHRLYYLEPADLKSWLQGVQFNYGTLLRLSEDQSLANIVLILADQLNAYPGMALPPVLDGLLRSITDGVPEVAAYPRLIPAASAESNVEASDSFAQLIVVKGQQQLGKSLPNEAIVSRIREAMNMDLGKGVSVRLTGEVALAHEEISAGLEGVGIAGVVSLILLAIILGFGVRSWQIIVTTFALLFVGVVLTSAYATLAVGSYNTLSLVFLVMFFGLGIDFAIHFSLKVRDESMSAGHRGAAERAAIDIGPALFLCTLTSAIGFLSFVPTAYNGLGELGVISAGGMVIAFILSITLLPAFYKVLGGLGSESGIRFAPPTEKLKPEITLAVFVMLVAVAVVIVKDMKFDYSVLALRDESSEGMQALLDLQRRKMVTDYSVVVVAASESESFELVRAIRDLEVVGDVFSVSDVVPKDQSEKHALFEPVLALVNTIELEEPLEENLRLKAALKYFHETQAQSSFPPSSLVDGFIVYATDTANRETVTNQSRKLEQTLRTQLASDLSDLKVLLAAKPFQVNDLPPSVLNNLITKKGGQLIRVQPAVPLDSRAATDRFISEVQKVAPNIAGRSVVEWGVGNVVVESFIEAVIYSAIAIFILLIVYFRGILLPILVLFPLSLAVLFTFAVAQVAGLTLNMANILVVPLIFGLGVDTGVHVIHRFNRSRNLSEAFISSTSRAVVISGLTTIGTFASLSLSPHKGAASIGILLSVSITILLITTFVALPALLSRISSQLR